jgi:hypothetical protein
VYTFDTPMVRNSQGRVAALADPNPTGA